jgi:hypothetical protein
MNLHCHQPHSIYRYRCYRNHVQPPLHSSRCREELLRTDDDPLSSSKRPATKIRPVNISLPRNMFLRLHSDLTLLRHSSGRTLLISQRTAHKKALFFVGYYAQFPSVSQSLAANCENSCATQTAEMDLPCGELSRHTVERITAADVVGAAM